MNLNVFQECLIEMLQDMFGDESVPKSFSGDRLEVEVNHTKASVDISTMEVTCENKVFKEIVATACNKLKQALMPPDRSSLAAIEQAKK